MRIKKLANVVILWVVLIALTYLGGKKKLKKIVACLWSQMDNAGFQLEFKTSFPVLVQECE